MKVGLDPIGKAMPMTLPGGGCQGPAVVVRLMMSRRSGLSGCAQPGVTSLSVPLSRLLVFSLVVLLLIASGRACLGTSGHPFFPLLFMTPSDRPGPLHYLSIRPPPIYL